MAGAFRLAFADLFLLELFLEPRFLFERTGGGRPLRDAPVLVAVEVAVFAVPSAFCPDARLDRRRRRRFAAPAAAPPPSPFRGWPASPIRADSRFGSSGLRALGPMLERKRRMKHAQSWMKGSA